MKIMNKLMAAVFMLLLIFSIGCQSTSSKFLGKTAVPELIVPLPGQANGEIWEAPDLLLRYNYSENGKSFVIDGELEMAQRYRAIFDKLIRAEVYLLFLDSESTVLSTVSLLSLLNEETEDRFTFRKKADIPLNAVSFSFAYEGFAAESVDRKRNSIDFWLHPK